jgi:anti-sigma28 factor (negative regulator of flagellin synthesis)
MINSEFEGELKLCTCDRAQNQRKDFELAMARLIYISGLLYIHLWWKLCVCRKMGLPVDDLAGKRDDTKKALGVWTAIQEEDLQPTPEFLRHLADYLTSKGEKVPFVVPNISEVKEKTQQQQNARNAAGQQQQMQQQQASQGQARRNGMSQAAPAESSRVAVLRRAIKNGDLEGALKLKEE